MNDYKYEATLEYAGLERPRGVPSEKKVVVEIYFDEGNPDDDENQDEIYELVAEQVYNDLDNYDYDVIGFTHIS